MQNSEFVLKTEFIEAQKDLLDLKKSELVPPLMLAKLEFLMCLIEGDKVDEDIIQLLPYYQRETLELLPEDTQIKLFTSTVRCLSGKEIITYIRRQRAYLQKQKGFFNWKKCYLDCTTKEFIIYQSRKSEVAMQNLQVSKLWISRFYKSYKKKSIFAIYFQNNKYVFGFDEEITCKRIHQILTSLICDHRQWRCTKYKKMEVQNKDLLNKLGPQNRKVEQAILSEQLDYLCSVQDRFQTYDLTDNGFKLFKNIGHGRILTNEKEGSVKISLILKDINQISLLESYILQSLWNKNIQVSKILGKPRSNSYYCYMKTNKYSFVSYPRDCFLSIIYYRPCQCRTQSNNTENSYLIIENIENESQPPQSSVVRMKFNQIIQISKTEQNQNILLMSITTKADYKGYSSISDNISMTLHLMNNIEEFVKQAQKNQRRGILDQIVCPCKGGEIRARGSDRIVSDFSVPTQKNLTFDEEFEQPSFYSVERKGSYKQSIIQQQEMIAQIQLTLKGIRNEAILQMLKQKKHHSYALQHNFSNKDECFRLYMGQNRQFLLQGSRWRFNGEEFQFMDQEILAAQKDILKMLIKQLGSNIMSGKSFMNMSLPVQIFDKKSMLDVIAEGLGFLPYYLAKAVDQKNPIEQIKFVTCAFMFMSATGPNVQKPFNPILGQTYQGKVGDFIVNLQQISHHPPISSVYIKSKQLQVYGNIEVSVDMGINGAYSKIHNWLHLNIYSSQTQYKIKTPDIEVRGLVYGARTYKFGHRGYVYEKSNNLFCEMSFGKGKKRIYEANQKLGPADLIGGVFRVREQFGQRVMKHSDKKAFQGLRPEDVIQNCCFLSGKWYGNIFFNDVSYKSIRDGPFPQKCFKLKYLLPSDSFFREDIIFKHWKDNDGSNREKERLENIQRNDRKLREKYRKK